MERLNADLQSLVDAERAEATPTQGELDGVRRSLLARVGTAAAAGATATTLAKTAAGAATGASGAAAAGAGAGLVLKLGASALVLGGLAVFALPRWASTTASSPKANVVATASAPRAPEAAAPASPTTAPVVPAGEPAPEERPVRTRSTASGASSVEHGAPPLAEEVRLLKAAQKALNAGNAAAALEALAEHQRRFPRGQLALERSAVRIGALCALGRTAEARRAGAAFLERHASSTLAEQVRGSCAGGGAR